MPARYTPYLQRGPNHYVDFNALAVQACKNIAAREAAKRRVLESGVREHQWELADSLVVVQEAADPVPNDPLRVPRTKWTTVSTPHNLPQLTVYGSLVEAEANGWTVHELMTRRLHRAFRDALVQGKICDGATANKRAREAKVHVADLGLA